MLGVGEETLRSDLSEKCTEIVVYRDIGVLAVVQAGAPQPCIVEFEAYNDTTTARRKK